ncbi:ATP-dependent DNA ligase [Candidatus Woesearchaeota archaeon]|nr:ATP-dependent DNA ligase [Candidatus Woesearchaeota archaeon]
MRYADLCGLYDALASTTKRLEKTRALQIFLQTTPKESLRHAIYLCQGTVFASHEKEKIGVADRLILKALSIATGAEESELEKSWKEIGDLGEVARSTIQKKRQSTLFSQPLTIEKVFDNIKRLVTMEGEGSVEKKLSLIAELLTSGSSNEAKYVIRTILGDLRLGVGDGVLRDAITWAFLYPDVPYNTEKNVLDLGEECRKKYDAIIEEVQSAYDILNDFADVAQRLRDRGSEGLRNMPIHVGRPLKVMLFQKADSVADAKKQVGAPCAFEYKYDGFRLQIHKNGDTVALFTRRLEDVTAQFPDIVGVVQRYVTAKQCIIDAEAVGIDPESGKYRAFQEISQRIKRRYNIDEIAQRFPVEIAVFDIIAKDGRDLLTMPFGERRKILETIVPLIPRAMAPSKMFITDNESAAQAFYQSSLDAGNEGVMAKSISAPYKPGSRVGFGVKVKPVMDALDLVIVGGEWGEGKRAGWITSFTVACKDDDTLKEIGRVGTGIKEKSEEGVSFEELTNLLRPHIVGESGRQVTIKPEIIIEVHYEEIQVSPTYASGFALRFPRFVRLRDDKSLDDVSTLSQVQDLYDDQRGRNANIDDASDGLV